MRNANKETVGQNGKTQLNRIKLTWKRKVFGLVVLTPKSAKPARDKWVLVGKQNKKHEIVRYKARLVAQGFSQIPGVDYDETYSPMVDATTFRYLISLGVYERLDLCLMDVVTSYFYGSRLS